MTIPKALLEKAGIGKEVVFAGNNHLIEIWDKEKYEAREMDSRDFVALAEKILG
jgi:MraZ protein